MAGSTFPAVALKLKKLDAIVDDTNSDLSVFGLLPRVTGCVVIVNVQLLS